MTLPQPKPPAAFRKQVFALLGESYGDKTLVLCPTLFVKLLDSDHKAAILLAQMLYWGDRTKDPDGWFYKSYADWQAETGLSETQVRRIVNGDPRVKSPQVTLRDLGVETLLRKVKRTGAPTLHYRINHERFLAALHALLGQSDSPHCAGSIPSSDEGQPPAMLRINTEQCAPSSLDPQTTSKTSAEDHFPSNPTHHPDDDSDLAIFFPFEARFGKLKNQPKEILRAELARLGTSKVGEVLERCTSHGRSWAYVLKALANEAASEIVAQTLPDERWGGLRAFDSTEGLHHRKGQSQRLSRYLSGCRHPGAASELKVRCGMPGQRPTINSNSNWIGLRSTASYAMRLWWTSTQKIIGSWCVVTPKSWTRNGLGLF